MGFIQNLSARIRGSMGQDKQQTLRKLARGATGSAPSGAFDLLNTYGHNALSEYLKLDQDILTRYVEYEEMDDTPLICSALNIFADDASQINLQKNHVIWAESKSTRVEEILNKLFHRTLRLDEEMWEISRSLCKTGNDYEELLITEDGVRGLNHLPAPTMRRVEGPRGELFGFIQDFTGKVGYTEDQFKQLLKKRGLTDEDANIIGNAGNADFDLVSAMEDWEVVHGRLRGKNRRAVYGSSQLESARYIWKRLMLLEDSALIFRLQRAPERYAFYVDMGSLPPQQALAELNKIRMMNRKKQFMDPNTNKLNLKFEQLTPMDDMYIPVRDGKKATQVETLQSPAWQSVEDINYFREIMFAAIQIPKAYLGMEEGVVRSVLSSQDVRFARSILRIQRELINMMSKVGRVHLSALNIDPFQEAYDIKMTVPSSIFELAQIEALSAKADLAGRLGLKFSDYYLYSKIFDINDDDIKVLMKQRERDMVRQGEWMGKQAAAQQAAMGAGMDQGGMPPGQQPPPFPDQGQGQQPPQAGGGGVQGAPAGPAPVQYPSQQTNSFARTTPLMTEQSLFRHSGGEPEKRVDDKLVKLLKNDSSMTARLQEIRGLLKEVVVASKRGA